MKYTRSQSFAICLLTYVLAILAGVVVVIWTSGMNDLIRIGLADIATTVVVFIFSFNFRNSSLYDPYWSVIPIAIAIFWIIQATGSPNQIRQILVLGLVIFWGARLTYNWARGWPGLHHEDWRYVDLSDKSGKMYWLVSFGGIHLFPTVLVLLGCLPMIPIMSDPSPLQLTDWLAGAFTLSAILIETFSDEQLRAFKKEPKGAFLRTGLWAYSRHPNYFGEVTFWVGIFLFALGLAPSANLWTGIGALGMLILFLFISIPMMDRRHVAQREGYEEYRKKVSAFVPWFPSK